VAWLIYDGGLMLIHLCFECYAVLANHNGFDAGQYIADVQNFTKPFHIHFNSQIWPIQTEQKKFKRANSESEVEKLKRASEEPEVPRLNYYAGPMLIHKCFDCKPVLVNHNGFSAGQYIANVQNLRKPL
jgi:hypothetical protein